MRKGPLYAHLASEGLPFRFLVILFFSNMFYYGDLDMWVSGVPGERLV